MKLIIEVQNEVMVDKVDKTISHICLVLVIYRHIDEVVLALMILVDLLQEHLLSVLVGDIPNHNSCAEIFPRLNLFEIDFIL